MNTAFKRIQEFFVEDKWRSAFIILLIIFVIHYMMMEGMLESFSQGPDPTLSITLYYKQDCPQCVPVFGHWATMVSNLTSDGRIKSRAVDCNDVNGSAECVKYNPTGVVPAIIKRQASGRTHLFTGNHHHANYYEFANQDY